MKRVFRACLASLFILAAPTLLAAKPRPPEPTVARFDFAHQLLRSGDEARDQGDLTTAIVFYDEAVKEYETLQQVFPDWEPAVTQFRDAYCRDERQKLKARLAARASAANAPSTPPTMSPPPAAPAASVSTNATPSTPAPTLAVLLPQARDLIKQGRSAEARDILMQAIRIRPDDMTTRLLIGTVQCQLVNYEDALFVLENLNEERPNDVATLLTLSAACLGVAQAERAAGYVRQALTVDPDSAAAHYNLARVLLVLASPQPTEALIHYERAVELGAAKDPEFEQRLAAPPAATNAPALQ